MDNNLYNIREMVNQMDIPDVKNCSLRLHRIMWIHALQILSCLKSLFILFHLNWAKKVNKMGVFIS